MLVVCRILQERESEKHRRDFAQDKEATFLEQTRRYLSHVQGKLLHRRLRGQVSPLLFKRTGRMTLFSETVAAAYSQGIAFSDELGQAAVDRKNNTFEDRST